MKPEGDDREQGIPSHILAAKRRYPVKNGPQAVLQTEVGIDKWLLFVD
jgi:hypothetical protein